MNERREPRLRASASRTWRSQSRRPTPATIPSRVSSDRATSRGDRIGSTTRVDHPTSLNTGFQKSKSWHIRGSLTTGRAASPNSEISVAAARARNSEATGWASRPMVKGAAIRPMASRCFEDLVVQRHNERRFPESPLVAGRGIHKVGRRATAKADQSAGDARRSAAMHAENDDRRNTRFQVAQ